MNSLNLKARAKINLTLDVLGRRDDGYHDLETIMQTLTLSDRVYIERIKKPGITLKSNLKWLPSDERNIAYKAADLMIREFDIKDGVFIRLEKRIPVAAGLAGGSSDCAAVIKGMSALFNLGLSISKMMELGGRLGSDVPFCIAEGTAVGRGRGEILQRLPACPKFEVVLAKLAVSVSTAGVYKSLDMSRVKNRPDNKMMEQALRNGDRASICSLMANVLESVTIPLYPKIDDIKNEMLRLGAEASLMSGSGPTVFGFFNNSADAKRAAFDIREIFNIKDVFHTKIYSPENVTEGDFK